MILTRPLVFWITMLAAVVAAIVLLREILLPFLAGMALAYLIDPLATRLERLGMNRLIATLAIMALFLGCVIVLWCWRPIIVRELARFIEQFPLYVGQLHALATDPSRPWLSKIIGESLGHAENRSASSPPWRPAGSPASRARCGRAGVR